MKRIMLQHFSLRYKLYFPCNYYFSFYLLTSYASGKTTGVVLDCGDGVTHVVPVFKGFSLPHAIERIDLAGRDITEHLLLLLRKNGVKFHTSAEFEIVKKIKENSC